MNVYLQGKRIPLDPARSLGQGGEAEVFRLGTGRALKIFKPPDHPDYQGLPEEQRAAEERIRQHQRKLREFPAGLPRRVVAPEELATDRSGRLVVGYAMELVHPAEPLVRWAEPAFRRAGVPNGAVVALFRDMHATVSRLHAAGVVIGDFNDLNVLVGAGQARFIDADSFQFGAYRCGVFTERFVDPLLCDGSASSLRLVRPCGPGSDWYAFAALLMQSLLFVGPYGGIYRPVRSSRRVLHGVRPLRRITVFHPEVHYPRPATSWRVLPDDLLHHLHGVFERDQRGPLPACAPRGATLHALPALRGRARPRRLPLLLPSCRGRRDRDHSRPRPGAVHPHLRDERGHRPRGRRARRPPARLPPGRRLPPRGRDGGPARTARSRPPLPRARGDDAVGPRRGGGAALAGARPGTALGGFRRDRARLRHQRAPPLLGQRRTPLPRRDVPLGNRPAGADRGRAAGADAPLGRADVRDGAVPRLEPVGRCSPSTPSAAA